MTKILSPSTLEQCCRSTIATSPKLGALPLRVALAASISYGNDWFPVNDVCQSLVSTKRGYTFGTAVIAQRLVQMGVAETRLHDTGGGFNIHLARLTCELVNQSHFHGQKSLKLRGPIETFYAKGPNASPVAALLLIGIYIFQIHQSRELGRFIEPEFNSKGNLSMCARTLGLLAKIAALAIVRIHPSPSRPFLVYPL